MWGRTVVCISDDEQRYASPYDTQDWSWSLWCCWWICGQVCYSSRFIVCIGLSGNVELGNWMYVFESKDPWMLRAEYRTEVPWNEEENGPNGCQKSRLTQLWDAWWALGVTCPGNDERKIIKSKSESRRRILPFFNQLPSIFRFGLPNLPNRESACHLFKMQKLYHWLFFWRKLCAKNSKKWPTKQRRLQKKRTDPFAAKITHI